MGALGFETDILPLKDRIFRLALRITLNRTEAEDIAQETLVRLWQQRDLWSTIGNMEAYALTIARRLALDAIKRPTTERLTEGAPTTEPLPDERMDQQQRVEAVRRLMDALPEVQRSIMLLRDVEGYRYDEIADITGLTETQVKVYLYRARKKIREGL